VPLPLSDSRNPLFNLSFSEQCRKISEWQQQGITARALFSLQSPFTQNDIKAAYKDLVLRFHPDKSPEALRERAAEAFKIIGLAKTFLEHEIGMRPENISSNPFYVVSPRLGGSASSARTASQQKKPPAPKKPQKPVSEMSFEELWDLKELTCSSKPWSKALSARLKSLIHADKSLINYAVFNSRDYTIFSLALKKADIEFIQWLLDEGADPHYLWINTERSWDRGCEKVCNAAALAARYNRLDVLALLKVRYGSALFFHPNLNPENTESLRCVVLEEAVKHGHTAVVHYLMEQLKFPANVDAQTIYKAWELLSFYSSPKNEEHREKDYQKACLTAALIGYGLFNKETIAQGFYFAVLKHMLQTADVLVNALYTQNIDFSFKDLLKKSMTYSNPIEPIDYLIKIFKEARYTDNNLIDILSLLGNEIPGYLRVKCKQDFAYKFLPEIITFISQYRAKNESERKAILSLRHYCANEGSFSHVLSEIYRQLTKDGKYTLIEQLLAIFPEAIHFPAPLPPLHQALYARKMADLDLRELKGCSSCEPYYFEANLEDYDATIGTLLNQAGEQLTQVITDDEFPSYPSLMHYCYKEHCIDNKYCQYTPLHLAIQLQLNKHASSILDKMANAGQSLEQTCRLKERIREPWSYVVKHYTALHLALEKSQYDLACDLIKHGADYKAMATIESPNPSWWQRCFWPVVKTHKSALSMIIETGSRKLISSIQLVQLDHYIKQRQKEALYKTRIMFFGHSLCNFGYSKDEKLRAAQALKEGLLQSYNHSTPLILDKTHEEVLTQGRLGAIAALTKHSYPYYLQFKTQPNLNIRN